MEHFINLEKLFLSDTQISNIEPLKGLINLTWLYLEGSKITNYTVASSYYDNLKGKDFIFP